MHLYTLEMGNVLKTTRMTRGLPSCGIPVPTLLGNPPHTHPDSTASPSHPEVTHFSPTAPGKKDTRRGRAATVSTEDGEVTAKVVVSSAERRRTRMSGEQSRDPLSGVSPASPPEGVGPPIGAALWGTGPAGQLALGPVPTAAVRFAMKLRLGGDRRPSQHSHRDDSTEG